MLPDNVQLAKTQTERLPRASYLPLGGLWSSLEPEFHFGSRHFFDAAKTHLKATYV